MSFSVCRVARKQITLYHLPGAASSFTQNPDDFIDRVVVIVVHHHAKVFLVGWLELRGFCIEVSSQQKVKALVNDLIGKYVHRQQPIVGKCLPRALGAG